MTSLLTTRPLLRFLNDRLNWDQLHQNVETGKAEALPVVTTGASAGRTSVFVEHPQSIPVIPESDDDRAIDYYRRAIDANVVRAPGAIPALFPPVLLDDRSDCHWYVDGGVRLSAPLKSAISLGATRLVVVAADPLDYLPALPGPQAPKPAPIMQDEAAEIGHGLLADRTVEAGTGMMLRVNSPRQRSPPCVRYPVSRSPYFTMPIAARTGVTQVYLNVQGGITYNYLGGHNHVSADPIPADSAIYRGHRVLCGGLGYINYNVQSRERPDGHARPEGYAQLLGLGPHGQL